MLSFFRHARPAGALLLAASSLWLSGCVTAPATPASLAAPATPEEAVAQRSKERWDAMIAGDFDKAWTYAQPGYRAAVKQRDYYKRFSGASQWTAMDVRKVECESERCTVRIRLTSKVMMPPFVGKEVTGGIDEIWVREDGQWWYYQAL